MTTQTARRAFGLAMATLLMVACADIDNNSEANSFALTGGSARLGRVAIQHYGCGSCHTIPGIQGATAIVGPPLTGMAGRAYIAGVVPNTPENMARWIQSPQAIDSRTAMPSVGATPNQARDMAAYMYTLR
jgi:cytochrome c